MLSPGPIGTDDTKEREPGERSCRKNVRALLPGFPCASLHQITSDALQGLPNALDRRLLLPTMLHELILEYHSLRSVIRATMH
jgi:hypothetical protein